MSARRPSPKYITEAIEAVRRPASAVDRYVESRLEKQREADAFHMGIDRPAPAAVVVKELEWVEDDDGWGAVNPFNTDEFMYMARPSRWKMTQEPCWELFEAAQTDDDKLPIKGACFDELDALKTACQADYTRRILSAVNAVSEARVRADERERLAKLAAKLPAFVASDDPSRSFDVAQWLRAQEGGK